VIQNPNNPIKTTGSFLLNEVNNLDVSLTNLNQKSDMTSSWFRRQGALYAIFHDGFWKSDHDLLIVFHINLLSGMYGFRDNEVLLQGGYDVIVISSLGGASGEFSW